ncbi:class I SAM-dependent methyltransferase [Paenibacillus swuensis]|uniref:class I SAM-dependent methyltransferase n=1 Tax=Paenibacillus swuensis TaxID=1178515 RepID=UPI000AE40BEA
MQVQLGCGFHKQKGFVGIDRFAVAGVDVVCDLDKGLPLEKNSVDVLVASHSLQFVDNLMYVMREIYRVCRHKAIVYIIAPYAHSQCHIGNPYNRYLFNEHTPRFFTGVDTYRAGSQPEVTPSEFVMDEDDPQPIPPEGRLPLFDPDGTQGPGMDLRLLSMEYSYFPEYRSSLLDEEERQLLRETQMNVVDEILYCFAVVKQDVSEEEWTELSARERTLSFDGFELEELTSHTIDCTQPVTEEIVDEQTTEPGADWTEESTVMQAENVQGVADVAEEIEAPQESPGHQPPSVVVNPRRKGRKGTKTANKKKVHRLVGKRSKSSKAGSSGSKRKSLSRNRG